MYTHICVVICYGCPRLSIAILDTCQSFRDVSLLQFTALYTFIPELLLSFPFADFLAEIIYIQGVPGGMCQTSRGCSLC